MKLSAVILLGALVAVAVAHEHEHHHAKSYKFEYGVKDSHTKDHKDQWEHGDGHNVKGAYNLDEPDGTKRVVEYVADHHGGFHAHVKRIGHANHPDKHGHGHAESYQNFNLHDH